MTHRTVRPNDEGSIAVEAAIVLPLFVALTFTTLLVAGGSIRAKQQASFAAQQAARAASLEQTPTAAQRTAETYLTTNSTRSGLTCTPTIDAGSMSPGSLITVTVSCEADLIGGLSSTFNATAIEVVDNYREGDGS